MSLWWDICGLVKIRNSGFSLRKCYGDIAKKICPPSMNHFLSHSNTMAQKVSMIDKIISYYGIWNTVLKSETLWNYRGIKFGEFLEHLWNDTLVYSEASMII